MWCIPSEPDMSIRPLTTPSLMTALSWCHGLSAQIASRKTQSCWALKESKWTVPLLLSRVMLSSMLEFSGGGLARLTH
jgi:hypothetical protein